MAHAAPSWSNPILVDPESYHALDILTSALQLSNGTILISWQSNRNSATGRTDVFYKSYTNYAWSTDTSLTTNGWNSSPSLLQLANGTVVVFWSYKAVSNYLIYSTSTNGRVWSSPVQVTSTTLNDTQPSAAVGSDGTIWLVWTRVDTTNPTVPAVKQLYYQTWKNGVWSIAIKLTNDSNQNFGSSVLIARDGTVWVVWSKGAAGNPYQLFYKTYNGVSWTSDTQIVTSSSSDEHPSLLQDRNGTLWLFWGRLIVVSTLIQYYDLFGKYSYNLGQTWSSEFDLTNNPSTGTVDSQMPNAIQSTTDVKPIWIFYSSNLNVSDLDIYAKISSGIGNVDDVRVSSITAYSNLGTSWEYPGGLASIGQSPFVTIKVAISNIGDFVETVYATLTATNTTSTTIGTVKNLIGPGNTINFYYYWNTTSVKPARYGFSISITPLPGQTIGNMGDNRYSIANQLRVIPLADVDQDGSVTITDVTVFFYDYNAKNGISPLYNPYCDLTNTGIINIVDIGISLANYNTFA